MGRRAWVWLVAGTAGTLAFLALFSSTIIADGGSYMTDTVSRDGVIRPSVPGVSSRTLLSYKSDSSRRIEREKKHIPRFNSHFERVSSDFRPHSHDYWESVFMIGMAAVLLGLLALVFGVFFWACRMCCDCCGGRHATRGCCFPTRLSPGHPLYGFDSVREYTRCQRVWPRVGLFIVSAVIVCAGVVGIFANDDFSSGVNSFVNAVVDHTQDAKDTALFVASTLQSSASLSGLVLDQSVVDATDELQSTLQDTENTARDLRRDVRSANKIRELVLFIVFSFSVVLVVFAAFLGSICGCKWPAGVLGVLGFLALFTVWVACGANLSVSVITADFCRAVRTYLDERKACEAENVVREREGRALLDCASSDTVPVMRDLNDVVKCHGTSDQDTLVGGDWVALATILFAKSAEGTFDPSARPYDPNNGTVRALLRDCANYNLAQFTAVGMYRMDPLNASTTVYGNGNMSTYVDAVARRAVLEADVAAGPCAEEVLVEFHGLLDGYEGFVGVESKIISSTSCEYVLDAFDSIQKHLCVDTLQSLDLIWVSFAAMGFFLFFAVFFGVRGLKRFHQHTHDDYEPVEEGHSFGMDIPPPRNREPAQGDTEVHPLLRD